MQIKSFFSHSCKFFLIVFYFPYVLMKEKQLNMQEIIQQNCY